MCSEYYCTMVYNVECSNDGQLAYSYNLIFSLGIQFFNSASFFAVEAELNYWYTEVSFWHDYNRSGTLTFKVKMAGLSLYYRLAGPYNSHNAQCGWFVFDAIVLQAYCCENVHITRVIIKFNNYRITSLCHLSFIKLLPGISHVSDKLVR